MTLDLRLDCRTGEGDAKVQRALDRSRHAP